MSLTKYVCLGCEDECKMDSTIKITGCVYEDGDYERTADIWVPEWTPKHIMKQKRLSLTNNSEGKTNE